MEFTVQQIADILQGRVEGDPQRKIRTLAKIEEAADGALAFLSNPKYESFLYTTSAGAVIVSDKLTVKQVITPALIRVEDPYLAFTTLLQEYQKAFLMQKNGVEEPAFMGQNSTIGENYFRGAFSYIGNNCK